MSYRVENLHDNTYQVLEKSFRGSAHLKTLYPEEYSDQVVFQGSLTDCDAYIRLHENGYM